MVDLHAFTSCITYVYEYKCNANLCEMQLKLNVGLQDGCHGNPFKRYFFVLASILKKHCKIADLNHDNHIVPMGRSDAALVQYNLIRY